MIDKTIETFYTKNATDGYADRYDVEHGPRIDWIINQYGLDKIENQRILDIGCGRGNFFKRMNPNNYFVGMDGANIDKNSKLCEFLSLRVDFNREDFGSLFDNEEKFDLIIASEVIEHISFIDNLIKQMKNLLKTNHYAIFTIPHESVTHPTSMPGLFFPESRFKEYIEQWSWIVEDERIYRENWWTCCYRVRNAPIQEARPKFFKNDDKFINAYPNQWSNL